MLAWWSFDDHVPFCLLRWSSGPGNHSRLAMDQDIVDGIPRAQPVLSRQTGGMPSCFNLATRSSGSESAIDDVPTQVKSAACSTRRHGHADSDAARLDHPPMLQLILNTTNISDPMSQAE